MPLHTTVSLNSYFLPTSIPLHQLETQYPTWSFQHQIPLVSSEELTLSRFGLCALSLLRCSKHSALLGKYFYRVGRVETPLCSNYGFKSQNLFHLVPDCPALDSILPAIFCHFLFILGLWSRSWGLSDYWNSAVLIRAPISRNGSGKTTTTTTMTT